MPASRNRHPERRSPRLAVYDYRREGLYFVTICTKGGALLFGDVVDGQMRLNEIGHIAEQEWRHTTALRPYVVPDAYVVMPNHVHLLFGLAEGDAHDDDRPGDDRPRDDRPRDDRRDMARHVPTTGPATSPATGPGNGPGNGPIRRFGKPPARSVSSVVGGYKSAATREANRRWGRSGGTIWQGRFHDRIVRNAGEHRRLRRYIEENPLRWHLDPYKP